MADRDDAGRCLSCGHQADQCECSCCWPGRYQQPGMYVYCKRCQRHYLRSQYLMHANARHRGK